MTAQRGCIGDGMCNGNPTAMEGQLLLSIIKIKEEVIGSKYDKGVLPLIVMPLLLHADLLIQGQGFFLTASIPTRGGNHVSSWSSG